MSKQTAVEFYINKLIEVLGDEIVNNLSIEQTNRIHYLSKEAKQMEREQIEDAYVDGITIAFGLEEPLEMDIENSIKYYEQTYGGNNGSN